ncbi:MAG: DUF1349 domain-containing protein [Azospirillaceae bacterium]
MTKEVRGFAEMRWLNPPPSHSVGSDGVLLACSGAKTDFWQGTFYGFQRDSGHALMRPVPPEFTATLTFEADYTTLYDQAGLMLRAGPSGWIKFGVEFTDGAPHLSVVVTDGMSDWSTQRLALDGPVTVRMTRLGAAILLHHADPAGPQGWSLARLAPFRGASGGLAVGPYLCSPERAGLEARFSDFRLGDPVSRDLH